MSLVHVNLPSSGSRSVSHPCEIALLKVCADVYPSPHSARILLTSRTPTSLTLQALPLLSILNHFTRRPSAAQTRVIGALLGKRIESGEVVITNSFAIPHDESRLFLAEQEFKSMLESIRKVSGDKESLVGWSVVLLLLVPV